MSFATVGCQCCLRHYDLSKSKKVSNIILPTRAQGLVKKTNRSVDSYNPVGQELWGREVPEAMEAEPRVLTPDQEPGRLRR